MAADTHSLLCFSFAFLMIMFTAGSFFHFTLRSTQFTLRRNTISCTQHNLLFAQHIGPSIFALSNRNTVLRQNINGQTIHQKPNRFLLLGASPSHPLSSFPWLRYWNFLHQTLAHALRFDNAPYGLPLRKYHPNNSLACWTHSHILSLTLLSLYDCGLIA